MAKEPIRTETDRGGNKVDIYDGHKETHKTDSWWHEVIEVSEDTGSFFSNYQKIAEVHPETSPFGVTTYNVETSDGESYTSRYDPNTFITSSDTTERKGKTTNESHSESILNNRRELKDNLSRDKIETESLEWEDVESYTIEENTNLKNRIKQSKLSSSPIKKREADLFSMCQLDITDKNIFQKELKNVLTSPSVTMNGLKMDNVLKLLVEESLYSETKILAINEISNRNILVNIAKENKDSDIRKIAIDKINSFCCVMGFASKDRSDTTRRYQRMLTDIAQNSKYIETRRAAIVNLENRKILEKISQNDVDIQIKNLANMNLEIISQQHASLELKREIINKIQDKETLKILAIHHKDREIRNSAVNGIKDEYVLIDIFNHSQSAETQKIAISRVNDQRLLLELLYKKNWEIQKILINRDSKQDYTWTPSDFYKIQTIRTIVVKQMTDQNMLRNILNDLSQIKEDQSLWLIIINQITDQSILGDIVKTISNTQMATLAKSRIKDPVILREVSRYKFYAAIKDMISALFGNN